MEFFLVIKKKLERNPEIINNLKMKIISIMRRKQIKIKFFNMNIFKKIRKKIKSTFLYDVLRNYFPKINKSFSETYGEDLLLIITLRI